MRKLVRPWMQEDDALLRRLVASGASAARASAMLKRTMANIKARARKLGTPFPNSRFKRKMQTRPEGEQRKEESLSPK